MTVIIVTSRWSVNWIHNEWPNGQMGIGINWNDGHGPYVIQTLDSTFTCDLIKFIAPFKKMKIQWLSIKKRENFVEVLYHEIKKNFSFRKSIKYEYFLKKRDFFVNTTRTHTHTHNTQLQLNDNKCGGALRDIKSKENVLCVRLPDAVQSTVVTVSVF